MIYIKTLTDKINDLIKKTFKSNVQDDKIFKRILWK